MEEVKQITDALQRLTIAAQPLNPDPEQTIGDFRREKRNATYLSLFAGVVSVLALVVGVLN
jgi:hypothetical protein